MASTIYLDNAATTKIDPLVLEAMLPFLGECYGNPSSTYSVGRTTRMGVESGRKKVAELLGTKPSSVFFTSGGTESNNTAILAAIRDYGCNCIITSPIEHHAVLHTVEFYSSIFNIPLCFVALTSEGTIDYTDLETKLNEQTGAGRKCLVSLMHANNETGALLDIARVGELCKSFNAIFHSDCVQTIGHYPIELNKVGVHFASASGHKFHGPKGTGILYIDSSLKIRPLIHGGGQERNMRAGTENVPGIIGFSKALEMAMQNYQSDSSHIQGVKNEMKQQLSQSVEGVSFNSPENSLYTVLSVCFPKSTFSDSLLLDLDMRNICVSGGSACSSGGGSHVMKALGKTDDCNTIRFSFSKYNNISEVETVVNILKNELSLKPSLI
jgi:cysteine desulfurase